jgi:hypothetical protein
VGNFRLAADANTAETVQFSSFADAVSRIPAVVEKGLKFVKLRKMDVNFVEYRRTDSIDNIGAASGVEYIPIGNYQDRQGDNKVMQTPILQAKVVAALEAEGLSATFLQRRLEVMGAAASVAEGSYLVRLSPLFLESCTLLFLLPFYIFMLQSGHVESVRALRWTLTVGIPAAPAGSKKRKARSTA